MEISSSSASLQRLQPPDLAQMREKLFKKTDADGSGSITKEELSDAIASMPKPPGGGEGPDADKMFTRMDVDGNGEVTQEEHDSALEQMDAQRKPPPAGGLEGSAEALQNLLTALQDEDSGGTSTTSTELEELLQKLIERLNQDSSYAADGSKNRGGTNNLFETSA
jgi:Ca2+-binding EF-hand superfamily protein